MPYGEIGTPNHAACNAAYDPDCNLGGGLGNSSNTITLEVREIPATTVESREQLGRDSDGCDSKGCDGDNQCIHAVPAECTEPHHCEPTPSQSEIELPAGSCNMEPNAQLQHGDACEAKQIERPRIPPVGCGAFVIRSAKRASRKKVNGMKKDSGSDGDIPSDAANKSRGFDKQLQLAYERRQRLQRQLQVTRYELELLCTGKGLSQLEDVALRVQCLEESVNGLRGKQHGAMSKPSSPEGVNSEHALPRSQQEWRQRLKKAERRVHELTHLSDKSEEALWELYARVMEEQLGAQDVISECAEKPEYHTNPHCPSRSLQPLTTMVPSNVEADRGSLYIHTDVSTLEMLIRDGSEGDSPIETVALFNQRSVPLTGQKHRHQSLSATLMVGHASVKSREIDMIVDTGAAESGADFNAFVSQYPELRDSITPVCDRRFVDAQSNEIPLVGQVMMQICLRDYCYWTRIYIFKRLGVPFLLGVNSIVDGNIIVHPAGKTMFPADEPTNRIPVRGAGDRLGCVLPHDQVECACSDGVTRDKVQVCCHQDFGTLEFDCDKGGQSVHCNLVETDEELVKLMTPTKRIPLRVVRRTVVPGKVGDRPGRAYAGLQYAEWIQGDDYGVMIEPNHELLQRVGLDPMEDQEICHSAFDAHALLPLINHSPNMIVVEPGEIGGYASPGVVGQSVLDDPGLASDSVHQTQRIMLKAELESYEELSQRPFAEGGPPVSEADWTELGLDLSDSIDAGRRRDDGTYEPLGDDIKDRIRAIASRWWLAWSRDDRAPRISRLVVIEIPTGDAKPIAQKPYPIPEKYKKAVMKEMQKLLDAGLIEPGISNWASPTLLTVKKDSGLGEDNLRVKIVCDFRKLNEVTIPDTGGLGNQEEILSGFGGDQKFSGILDMAGGFYQFALHERDRHKSAFVLPTSMGGTTFIWRVAPYGLCRNPASYSRGMMFALQGLQEVPLSPLGESTGGSHSWIDDVTCHASSMEGFLDLFERILQRCCHCGLQLKASKAHLLKARLEVLGFDVTPDGLQMQEKKVEAIRRIPPPTTIEEVRVYLGAVNFYRRFIPHIGLLAKPLTDIMRKGGSYDQVAVEAAVSAINSFLISDTVIGLPEFTDPQAEFVVCPDACNVAVGGVLMQWQHPQRPGPGPPAGVPLRGETGQDPITQSWREAAGWRLVTLGFYSKSLDKAQKNYNVFDKEAGAILLCMRQWADWLVGIPVTVYTDSSVAASMLTKYRGTTRLHRWGMELMQFMPYLKIAYRKGSDNGLADLLSRFPLFKRYIPTAEHTVELPDDLFDKIGEAVSSPVARVHAQLVPVGGTVSLFLRPRTDYFELYEAKGGIEVDEVWQEESEPVADTLKEAVEQLTVNVVLSEHANILMDRLQCFIDSIDNSLFTQEQRLFEKELEPWRLYSQTYAVTSGSGPVVYDLYCGEGGFSRGARAMGAQCYGFDSHGKVRHAYEHDPVYKNGRRTYMDSGMVFTQRDVDEQAFWEELAVRGRIGDLPPPDIIHASPLCGHFSRIGRLDPSKRDGPIDASQLNQLLSRLKTFAENARSPVIWQVENVPECLPHLDHTCPYTLLCGTMMGHRVFRHRIFLGNYEVQNDLPHDHRGKKVGSRGLRLEDGMDVGPPNMYGVYSSRSRHRGSHDEWEGALGSLPGTYTRTGIAGVLPMGYGRYLTGQMIAWLSHRRWGIPVWTKSELSDLRLAALNSWAIRGYPHHLAVTCPVAVTRDQTTSLKGVATRLEGVVEKSTHSPTHAYVMPVVDLNKATELPRIPRPDLDPARPANASVFHVGLEDQAGDPDIACVLRELHDPNSAASRGGQFVVHSNGLVYRRHVTSTGELGLRLWLPSILHYEVLHYSHYTFDPGHCSRALFTHLEPLYYWPHMRLDCEEFVRSCEQCGEHTAVAARQVDPGFAPSPKRPFEVLHIDFKGPLKGSDTYDHILVVVCALTRYTLYLPTKGRESVTVFRALINGVFSIFGLPRAIVSDNANEFRGELAAEMAQYLGYRKIHVLPWRPQANGLAEAAVKRIRTLLERHTRRFNQWHKVLPLAQYALNTSTHHGLGNRHGICAYAALFGREPTQLPELENPDLAPVDGDGNEFVQTLRERLRILHEHLNEDSDAIRRKRQATAIAKTKPTGAKPIKEGDLVWLQYGNPNRARQLARQGEAFRHPYRVVEVSEFGARLQPTVGSKRVLDWQPLHLLQHSPPQFHDNKPLYDISDDGLVLAPGVARQRTLVNPDPSNPFNVLEDSGPPPDDDGAYQIERVGRARKVGNKWQVEIKWVGYAMPTEESRAWMKENCDDSEILSSIEHAIAAARLETEPEEIPSSDSEDDDVAEICCYSDGARPTAVANREQCPAYVKIYLIQYLRAYRSLC